MDSINYPFDDFVVVSFVSCSGGLCSKQMYVCRAKIQLFFLFAPNDPFGELFSKIIFKSSREFLFWQKFTQVRNRPKCT